MSVRPFVFSCDAHLAEPPELFQAGMPAGMEEHVLQVITRDDGDRSLYIGDRRVLKMGHNFATHRTGISDTQFAEQAVDTTRRGIRNLELRLADMDRDGVDAELLFPTMGLFIPRILDPDAQAAACRLYNDWAWEYCAPARERLIPAAMIPCSDLAVGLAECERTAAKGYAAFVLWEGLDNYNDPAWDPIFAFAGSNGIPLVFHTGLGDIDIRALRGPGGALYNYTRLMNDAVEIITQLVGGGVLDRNPDAHIVFAEHSAGWLWGLAERMDEVYQGHAPSITPKLSRRPSQIVRDQVHCALQNDIGSIATRRGVGIGALMFATDYPHSEGTFPFSRDLVDRMRGEHPDLTIDEFAAVLGGNAADVFTRAGLRPLVDARTEQLKAELQPA